VVYKGGMLKMLRTVIGIRIIHPVA
jgi:hypothetical protein